MTEDFEYEPEGFGRNGSQSIGGQNLQTTEGNDVEVIDAELSRGDTSETETDYVDANVVDTDYDNNETDDSEGVFGSNVSRRDATLGAGLAALGLAGIGGAVYASGDREESSTAPVADGIENPNEYIWRSESNLIDATDEELCYLGRGRENYFGAADADEIENILEDHVNGEDSTGLLSDEEKGYGFDDITPHQGAYAVNVGRKLDSDGNHGGLFLQIKGQEDDEGVFVTRQGAVELAESVDYQEVWNTCN